MSRLQELVCPEGRDNEATNLPFWYVAVKGGAVIGRPVMVSRGIWFSRGAAEEHLKNKAHRYPKTAFVYCDSGHDSVDMKQLYRLASGETGPRVIVEGVIEELKKKIAAEDGQTRRRDQFEGAVSALESLIEEAIL